MTSPAELDRRLAEAKRISGLAARRAREYFDSPKRLEVSLKGQQDWVSEADRAVEALVKEELRRSFPGEGFLGEEGGLEGDTSAIWVCDPIDGTTNFVRGMPAFAVTLAFVAEGRTQLGVTEEPAFGRTYAARRGGGAFCGEARLRVAAPASVDQAVIGLGFSLRRDRPRFLSSLDAIFDLGVEFRRIGSAAICLAYVASGHLDGFWQVHLNSWDVLSGLLLVEEAGGLCSDFLAQDGLTRGNPVLAGAGAVLSALAGPLEISVP